ncbi:unnamed protein product [Trichogramma brassicae]|uniref:Uncharacterized protein n=1 Tax=Trichogramma brassicae TaxID=86971 RepID=A0A6H5IGQ2_9HYME|nr:unnamed protein product [Trichogramma brassicae]
MAFEPIEWKVRQTALHAKLPNNIRRLHRRYGARGAIRGGQHHLHERHYILQQSRGQNSHDATDQGGAAQTQFLHEIRRGRRGRGHRRRGHPENESKLQDLDSRRGRRPAGGLRREGATAEQRLHVQTGPSQELPSLRREELRSSRIAGIFVILARFFGLRHDLLLQQSGKK